VLCGHGAAVSSDRAQLGRGPRVSICLLALATSLPAACGGVDHDLRTASELYRDARYEAVQAWAVQLRREQGEMAPAQRATFHYISGMTAYRLSQPDEALHELALAAHVAREQAKALSTDQLALLNRTLEELIAARANPRDAAP